MDADKIQNDIDALLVFTNDEMESNGGTIKDTYFEFDQGLSDRVKIDAQLGWAEDYLFKIINICHSRGLMRKGYDEYSDIKLTEEGQSRALSVKHGKNRSYELSGGSYTIGAINIAGSAQVGNHNTQNIHNVFQEVIDKIDKSDATPEEKAEAKSLLTKFLEHPLTSSVVGGAIGSFSNLF